MDKWYRKSAALLSQIYETNPADNEIALWFIGQCGFILKHKGKIILIDPVLNDITGDDGTTRRHYPAPFAPNALKPDYVLCTHGHIDHMAMETLCAIAKAYPETRFVIPEGCKVLAEGSLPAGAIVGMADGEDVALCSFLRVHAFSAAHPEHTMHPDDENMALGYQLELSGIRVVHLGDTYLTERLLHSLEALDAPHIFLPPINGDDRFRAMRNCIGNMEAEEAAKLAVHLRSDLSIPTHYDMIFGNNVDPLRFAAEVRRLSPAAKWKIPALGERIFYKL